VEAEEQPGAVPIDKPEPVGAADAPDAAAAE